MSHPFFSAAALYLWVADEIGAGRLASLLLAKGNPLCQRAACNAPQRAQCTGTVRIIAPSHSEGSACLNIGAPDRYPFVPGHCVTKQFLHGAIGIPSTNRQHLIDDLLDTAKAEHIVQQSLHIVVGQ